MYIYFVFITIMSLLINNALAVSGKLTVGTWYQDVGFYALVIGGLYVNYWLIKHKGTNKPAVKNEEQTPFEILLKENNNLRSKLNSLNNELLLTGEELELAYIEADRLSTGLLQALDYMPVDVSLPSIERWSVNLASKKVSLSENAKALHGLPPGKDLTFDEGMAMIDPAYQKEVNEAMQSSLRTGERTMRHYKIHPLDGSSPRWIKASWKPRYDEKGNAAQLDGNFILTRS